MSEWLDVRILLVAGAGSVLVLDRRAALQVMLSHPVVAATLMGWALGELEIGLAVGVLVGLLWSGALPVGGVVPADETLGATVGVGVAVLGARASGMPVEAAAMTGFIAAIPSSMVGRQVELALRRLNGELVRRTETAVAAGSVAAIERATALSIGAALVSVFVTHLVLLSMFVPAARLAFGFFPDVGGVLAAAALPVPIAGAGAVIVGAGFRLGLIWATLGFTIGLVVTGVAG